LSRSFSTAEKTCDNHGDQDHHEHGICDRRERSAYCSIMELFPSVEDRPKNQDPAPEPFAPLGHSLEAGIDEWHFDGL